MATDPDNINETAGHFSAYFMQPNSKHFDEVLGHFTTMFVAIKVAISVSDVWTVPAVHAVTEMDICTTLGDIVAVCL